MATATPKTAPGHGAAPGLDNLTLARKEGWQRFVDTPARTPPEPLSRNELESLSDDAFDDYNLRRREWHANLGPIKTPQLAALHEDLWDIVDSNLQDGDKPKGAVAIDAFPGLGKTTSVLDFAKKYHLREIKEQGATTAEGNERWPVCRVGLTGNTGMVEFNRAMLSFFAHPGVSRDNAAHFAHRALDCVLACHTKLLIVDDLHFLRWRNTAGVEISNHFKYIAADHRVPTHPAGVFHPRPAGQRCHLACHVLISSNPVLGSLTHRGREPRLGLTERAANSAGMYGVAPAARAFLTL